jgi:DNA-binding transcriptional regulator YiaG
MIDPFYDLRINQELDRQLVPCPTCHHEYNDPHKGRRGPTCLDKFTGDKLHIVCLNCWTIGKAFKKQADAIDSWNAGELARDKSEKPKLRKMREAKGLTCAEIGATVNLSESSIRRWERGAQKIPSEKQAIIESVLAL